MNLRCLLTLSLSLAVATGCGHPMQRKLQGRWLGQGVENVDDAAFAAASGWAKGVSMEFAGSAITVAVPAEEPRTGTFKVLGVRDGQVDLSISDPNGKSTRSRFKLDDERSLRWMIGDGRAVVLRRDE